MLITKEVVRRYRETRCQHAHVISTLYIHKNDGKAVWMQCQDCGESTGSPRRSRYRLNQLPPFNKQLREQKRAERAERFSHILNELSTNP